MHTLLFLNAIYNFVVAYFVFAIGWKFWIELDLGGKYWSLSSSMHKVRRGLKYTAFFTSWITNKTAASLSMKGQQEKSVCVC